SARTSRGSATRSSATGATAPRDRAWAFTPGAWRSTIPPTDGGSSSRRGRRRVSVRLAREHPRGPVARRVEQHAALVLRFAQALLRLPQRLTLRLLLDPQAPVE